LSFANLRALNLYSILSVKQPSMQLNNCEHAKFYSLVDSFFLLCCSHYIAMSAFFFRDRSSPVKKNTQIFLVVVGVVSRLRSAQSAAAHARFYE